MIMFYGRESALSAIFLLAIFVQSSLSFFNGNFSNIVTQKKDEPLKVNIKETVVFTKQMVRSYRKGGILFIAESDIGHASAALPNDLKFRRKRATGQSPYSPYTCCRKDKFLKTRTRTWNDVMTIETANCYSNYCADCENTASFCEVLVNRAKHLCNSAFMFHYCPRSCSICTKPKPKPVFLPATQVVVVYQKLAYPRDKFQYLLSTSSAPRNGYHPTNESVKTITMYSRPTIKFPTKVYFCFRNEEDGDFVSLNPCPLGLRQRFALYGQGSYLNQNKVILTYDVGTNTMISKSRPCCGYTTKPNRFFFVKDINQQTPSVGATKTPPLYPNGLNRPVTPALTPRPIVITVRPISPSPSTPARSNLTPDQQKCLDAHNYFRARHNTRALEWDASLARSASLWADHLSRAAPTSPDQLRPGYTKTPYWPHSIIGSVYRPFNVGENIALSPRTASQGEIVDYWYSEVFDYDQATGAATSSKPIGHYTQLLWKGTTRVGCAKASNSNTQSYVVAHYRLAGNYKATILNNVLPPKQGTCFQKSCAIGHQCLAFGQGSRCGCGSGRSSICSGTEGCLARCGTHFCKGNNYCRCIGNRADCT